MPHRWYVEVSRSRVARTVLDIAADILITLVLLAGLSLVHSTLSRIDASDGFKQYFSRFHEWMALIAYVVVAAKGVVRIVKH